MPYITREDGERFVIPSYRDVLTAKNKNALKKNILALCQSYGEYITLQRKDAMRYEVAFSTDQGYLLGESIWHHFNRPLEMIYCEAIPETTEAILVIVKSGSVYLDGRFPIESIPDELVIFLTQQNNFEIYVYGDVPISKMPESDKVSFEAGSVKSFTVLDKPVFNTLPLLKMYQLQLVDQVLRAYGIGQISLKQIALILVAIGALWFVWDWFAGEGEIQEIILANPYQSYYDEIASPAPDLIMQQLDARLKQLFSMPGWMPANIKFSKGTGLAVLVKSTDSKVEDLYAWAKGHDATIDIQADGIYVMMDITVPNRAIPNKIYPVKQVIASFVDKLAVVYPGNHLRLGSFKRRGEVTLVPITIEVEGTLPLLSMIGQQFQSMPFVLREIAVDVENGNLTGSITLDALGS